LQAAAGTSPTQGQTVLSASTSKSTSTQSNPTSDNPPMIAAISGNVEQATPAPALRRPIVSFGGSSAGPMTPESTTQSHLEFTQQALDQALTSLNGARNTFGEFKDKAIAEVNQGQADITHAMDYLKAVPEIEFAPSPAPSAISPTGVTDVLSSGKNNVPTGYGPMHTAMNLLIVAHGYLVGNTAGDFQVGNMGGLREGILADLDQAAADILAGVNIALVSNPPAPAPAKPAATTPLNRNMTVRLQGTFARGYKVDLAYTGVGAFNEPMQDFGETEVNGTIVPIHGQADINVSMAGGDIQVSFVVSLFIPTDMGGGNTGSMKIEVSNKGVLKPGESLGATSPDGDSKITATLSEATD
jgi:hypothetical protein